MRLGPVVLLVLIPLASACGSETTDPLARSPADAAPADIAVDQPAAVDSPAVDHDAATSHDDATGHDAAADAPADGATGKALHGCADGRFVDRSGGTEDDRMIMATRSNLYDPPCMMIRAGQAVMFMSSFTSHPLAPGVAPGQSGAGTTPSPIRMRTTGTVYNVTFPTAGDYPFYCTYHAGGGMYGVVRVMP